MKAMLCRTYVISFHQEASYNICYYDYKRLKRGISLCKNAATSSWQVK